MTVNLAKVMIGKWYATEIRLSVLSAVDYAKGDSIRARIASQAQKEVTIHHVNAILIQPHWRTHEELLTQQVPK